MISKIENWPLRYIGDEWVSGSHDCWGFARRVWAECFGLDVPVIDIDAIKTLDVCRAFKIHPELKNWKPAVRPYEGYGVIMSQSKSVHHVGIWTELGGSGIVHCVKGSGVIFTAPSALLLMGYHILGCYRRIKNG